MMKKILSFFSILISFITSAQTTEYFSKDGITVKLINTAPNFDKNLKDKIVNTFLTTYPKMCEHFGQTKRDTTQITISKKFKAVAYVSNKKMTIGADFISKRPGNTDLVVHEAMHIVQGYKKKNPVKIGWLQEGMADYSRHKFGINNKQGGWQLPQPKNGQHYTDSYRVSGAFFNWVDQEYNKKKLIIKLDSTLRSGTYTHDFWKKHTKRTLDALWTSYIARANKKYFSKNGKTVVIINEEPKVTDSIIAKIADRFLEVFPKMANDFHPTSQDTTEILIRQDYKGAAYVHNKKMGIGSKWLLNKPKTMDAITHEAMHIVQNYDWSKTGPLWITEGLADYARYIYGVDDKNGGRWKLNPPKADAHYKNAYGVSARFFLWLAENYDKDIPKTLDFHMREGTYSKTLWKKLTGKSLDKLWDSYMEMHSLKKEKKDNFTLSFYNTDFHLNSETKKKLSKTFFKVYPQLVNDFNQKAKKDIQIKIDTAYKAVAYAQWRKSQIVISADWLRNKPKDTDLLTHEVMHLIQSYPTYNAPWLVEGICDYVRHKYGVANKAAGWSLKPYSEKHNYKDAYRVTGRFLLWLTQKYDSKIVEKLDTILRQGSYDTKDWWKEYTQKSLEELWTEYKASHDDVKF